MALLSKVREWVHQWWRPPSFQLEITDSGHELIATAEQPPPRGFEAEMAGLTTALAIYFWVSVLSWATGLVAIAVAAAGGAVSFAFAKRTKTFTLRVSPESLTSRGRVGDGWRATRSLGCDEVHWLEYQEDQTGADDRSHPEGLYAVIRPRAGHPMPELATRNICLLPYIDETQVLQVIERIETKFPELGGRWATASTLGERFTLLGLSEGRKSSGVEGAEERP